jgi:hypothetical protein
MLPRVIEMVLVPYPPKCRAGRRSCIVGPYPRKPLSDRVVSPQFRLMWGEVKMSQIFGCLLILGAIGYSALLATPLTTAAKCSTVQRRRSLLQGALTASVVIVFVTNAAIGVVLALGLWKPF